MLHRLKFTFSVDLDLWRSKHANKGFHLGSRWFILWFSARWESRSLNYWRDCSSCDEKLCPFTFAVSTLASSQVEWLPQCGTLYIPPWVLLNPKSIGPSVGHHYGALGGKRGLVLWEIIEVTFLWMSELEPHLCFHCCGPHNWLKPFVSRLWGLLLILARTIIH